MTKNRRRILQFTITIIFLVAGVMGLRTLKASKPELQKREHTTPLPLARVIPVVTGPRAVVVTGYGTVGPIREIPLVPEVSGKVTRVAASLVNGGTFKKGDLLLMIDPVDYEIAVTLASAKLKDAESKFQLAKEEAAVARDEWAQLHKRGKPPALVAKEPQLAAAQAKLAAEKADLRKARLRLERTRLVAPFDGRVSTKSVDVGQYVTPGQKLAVLYATDAVEIVLPMEDSDLYWFHVPGFTPGNGQGAEAEVRARVAGQERTWKGRVVRAQGELDARTRMVNVVVRVEKPYAQKPPLAIGIFATVDIGGRTIENAAVLPRAAIRSDDTVWVVGEDNRLIFRSVTIARYSTRGAVVRDGLVQGERVVTSILKGVSDGMQVRPVAVNPEDQP
jgi:RND family efflux transporter MFP subunit